METLKLIENDPWLKVHSQVILSRYQEAIQKENELTQGQSLREFANGYNYYGLHRTDDQWIFRDWAPNATAIYLIGECNHWAKEEAYRFQSVGNGNWELVLGHDQLKHGDLYAFHIEWDGGQGTRIPAWVNRAVQDDTTKLFSAQVWGPEQTYQWKNPDFSRGDDAPLVYESHVGMAGEEERVHSYNEFREQVLPRIKAAGYNTVQLMAVPEHPYYGSFGYHVSSFFAPSSRFGTPDELKALIDEAHGMGLAVIMDLVHSHAVKNENEGLGRYDGTRYQFFHDGGKGEHPAWDSYCFNYGKNEVLHFLLSNIRWWLEEFKFDGFRFDGVTSMLYFDHGLGKAFTGYDDYYNANVDVEATTYFYLANKLIHEINPKALSIAEEMSGMPGLASPLADGGLGFDYRMAMGVPDFWIKLIKEVADENWDVGQIFYELTSKRMDEKVVSYAESHDQALVGDKTIIFRLIDKEMYFSMRKDQPNMTVDRGIALHKMIRLITAATAGGSYLNFMGNEFGHPEWIDFPREGNNWSFKHARRLWSIAEDKELRFHWLADFDREMIHWIQDHHVLNIPEVYHRFDNKGDQILAFQRGDYLLVFNFNPVQSFTGYGIPLEASKWKILFDTDEDRFGGQGRIDHSMTYYTKPSGGLTSQHYLNLYLPARTAMVLKKQAFKRVR
ncbi:alpha amylase C-terminal domain-containing protein [Mangrovibacterium marinum]|uniref:1,4-alpha-glucan branching enzyme n=1 Tax=Mangrovibacterium marinum TaxID=1639118 RepID=A0A2T5BYI2_9BACT|nr:alpha amylase C-terminal domain-containing protein [Mangrovibacterium marinum]PTN07302.1 1,4-alpha-glucan branching enzyme [Mangrovibacterium marinum]